MDTNFHEWGGTREWERMRGRWRGGLVYGAGSGLSEPGYHGVGWRGGVSAGGGMKDRGAIKDRFLFLHYLFWGD